MLFFILLGIEYRVSIKYIIEDNGLKENKRVFLKIVMSQITFKLSKPVIHFFFFLFVSAFVQKGILSTYCFSFLFWSHSGCKKLVDMALSYILFKKYHLFSSFLIFGIVLLA